MASTMKRGPEVELVLPAILPSQGLVSGATPSSPGGTALSIPHPRGRGHHGAQTTQNALPNDCIPADILRCLVPRPPGLELNTNGSVRGLKSGKAGKTILAKLPVPLESRLQHAAPPNPAPPADDARATSPSKSHGPPANVWHHPERRKKFKHLYEQAPCVCGAGSDISFLYDATNVGNATATSELPTDAVLPEEYSIAVHEGARQLEFKDDLYTTVLDDHPHHHTAFPSMKPASRHDAIKLKEALGALLRKVGISDTPRSLDNLEDAAAAHTGTQQIDEASTTHIHSLLDLARREQDVYNLVFAELVRQVTVGCVERGEVLADLRKGYNALLNRMPRHVIGLHAELVASRALTRRLTDELMRFRTSMADLTKELAQVRRHDAEVGEQARKAQAKLTAAIADSERNASIVAEYHALYDMQRQRLEATIDKITTEKQSWSNAAHSLASKVSSERGLGDFMHLQQCEKSWSQLARHFAVVLGDVNTKQMQGLRGQIDGWRAEVMAFSARLTGDDESALAKIVAVHNQIRSWVSHLEDGMISGEPIGLNVSSVERLSEDIKYWEEVFGFYVERFSGDSLLSNQEEISRFNKMVDGWTSTASRIFGRQNNESLREDLISLSNEVDESMAKIAGRVTGETSAAKALVNLLNPMETWANRLSTLVYGEQSLSVTDRVKLHTFLADWAGQVAQVIDRLQSGNIAIKSDFRRLLDAVEGWLENTMGKIDSEDELFVEQVSGLHVGMISWMVDLLMLATGCGEKGSHEMSTVYQYLCQQLDSFTKRLAGGCAGIESPLAEGADARDAVADDDRVAQDLLILRSECDDWIKMAGALMNDELSATGPKRQDSIGAHISSIARVAGSRKGSMAVPRSSSVVSNDPAMKTMDDALAQATGQIDNISEGFESDLCEHGALIAALRSEVQGLSDKLRAAEERSRMSEDRATRLTAELESAIRDGDREEGPPLFGRTAGTGASGDSLEDVRGQGGKEADEQMVARLVVLEERLRTVEGRPTKPIPAAKVSIDRRSQMLEDRIKALSAQPFITDDMLTLQNTLNTSSRLWGFVRHAFRPNRSGRPIETVVLEIRELYDAKLRSDALDDADNYEREPFPEFIRAHFQARYGAGRMADQRIIDLVTASQRFRADCPEIDLFARFAEESFPLDRLSLVLFARACAHRLAEGTKVPRESLSSLPEFVDLARAEAVARKCFAALSREVSEQLLHALYARSVPMSDLAHLPHVTEKSPEAVDPVVGALPKHRRLSLTDLHLLLLEEYETAQREYTGTVVALTSAADHDADGRLTRREFAHVMLYLQPRMSTRSMLRLYRSQAAAGGDPTIEVARVQSIAMALHNEGLQFALRLLPPLLNAPDHDLEAMRQSVRQRWERMHDKVSLLSAKLSASPLHGDRAVSSLIKRDADLLDTDLMSGDPRIAYVRYRDILGHIMRHRNAMVCWEVVAGNEASSAAIGHSAVEDECNALEPIVESHTTSYAPPREDDADPQVDEAELDEADGELLDPVVVDALSPQGVSLGVLNDLLHEIGLIKPDDSVGPPVAPLTVPAIEEHDDTTTVDDFASSTDDQHMADNYASAL